MNYRYLAKRLLYMVVSIFIILTIVFSITHVLPGSAADVILGTTATEESVAQLEQQLGIDQPVHVQYVEWVAGLATGDWGTSLTTGKPVAEMVVPRFVRSLYLATLTLLFVVATAIPLGVVAAAKRDSFADSAISLSSYAGVSVPSFVSASLLLLALAGPPLSLFPSGGYQPLSEGVITWLYHMILPAISLSILIFAHVMRQTRSSLIDALEGEYVRAARLKGMPEYRVLFFHALRNGLLPTITVLALNFGWLMGSIVIVEDIFAYPGIGQLIIDAISERDIPVIQMGILVATVSYVVANFAADLLYTYLDPRINLGD